jgi:ATP-binding cassette subfamily A (ABC1) protein 1
MVSGRLQCIGSCQHLKDKFGDCYQLDVRCHETSRDICIKKVLDVFPGSSVEEAHGSHFRAKLFGELDLAHSFSILEDLKKQTIVLDYSLTQATLEQIFINFAKNQEEERGQVSGMQYTAL